MDPLLKAYGTGTRLWAGGQADRSPTIAFTTALILGWWREIPEAGSLFAWHVAGVALLLFEIKRPNRTSWLFRYWYPLPYVAACYKEMALLIPPIRRTSADQWLADLDFRLWGAHPTVWLERIQSPVAHRISADRLYPFCTGRTAGGVSALASAAISRVPILCIFNRLRIPGFLRRVLTGSGARPAISLEPFAAHTVTRTVAVSRHAGYAGSAGIRPLRLFSRAVTPNSPSWRGGPAAWLEIGCFGSISLTLRPSFLLQFIFDTTIRLTCWREPLWRQL